MKRFIALSTLIGLCLFQSSAFAVTKTNVQGVYLDISQQWRNWLLYAEE